MAQVTCSNCGRRRVVMDGKRKRCRKCGTPLTPRTGRAAPVAEVEAVETDNAAAKDTTKTEAEKKASNAKDKK